MLTVLRKALGLVVLIVGLVLAPNLAAHNNDADHEQARRALAAGEVLPLSAVLSGISDSYPGRVIKVNFKRHEGSWLYRIKVLQKGGQLLMLSVDAQTGDVIDVKRGRARPRRNN